MNLLVSRTSDELGGCVIHSPPHLDAFALQRKDFSMTAVLETLR
jgi:hypothetical protein